MGNSTALGNDTNFIWNVVLAFSIISVINLEMVQNLPYPKISPKPQHTEFVCSWVMPMYSGVARGGAWGWPPSWQNHFPPFAPQWNFTLYRGLWRPPIFVLFSPPWENVSPFSPPHFQKSGYATAHVKSSSYRYTLTPTSLNYFVSHAGTDKEEYLGTGGGKGAGTGAKDGACKGSVKDVPDGAADDECTPSNGGGNHGAILGSDFYINMVTKICLFYQVFGQKVFNLISWIFFPIHVKKMNVPP